MIVKRLLLILALMLGAAAPAVAQDYGPDIPKATGEPHPEGNDYMRRWHMTMMKHDRDVTMYEGVRPVGASLAQCFDCHTVKDEQGTPVTYEDERHFCRTCHDYAAVKVDCFDCHRSTPEGFEEPALHAQSFWDRVLPRKEEDMIEVLQAYLDDVTAGASQ